MGRTAGSCEEGSNRESRGRMLASLPELYLSLHPAAFQATVAQLVVDPWTFHSLSFSLMPSLLVAAFAPFLELIDQFGP